MTQEDWMSVLSGIGGNSLPPRRPHVAPSRRAHFPRPLSQSRVSLVERISASLASKTVSDVLNFVSSYGLPYGSWYVGITGTPWSRLHSGHGTVMGDPRQYWDAGSDAVAQRAEKKLLELGFDGGAGGGSEIGPKFVYVFLKQSPTRR
jgi:hypothetical protein